MATNFKPSKASLSPQQGEAAALRYMQKAVGVLEAQLKEEGDFPPWVKRQIYQAASSLGMAVSYVTFSKNKKFKKE